MISLSELVRKVEQNYTRGSIKLGDYVDWNMHDTIETIIAYVNSKHITGEKDSLGRDKPFFNIVTAAINIWYRATNIDRKDITVKPDNSSTIVAAFLATVHLQSWMKHEGFGLFLKRWGRELAKFGSAVVKFVEKDGRLIPTVVPWSRIICDPVDFDALPRIEKFYKTPAQLRKMKEYDQSAVNGLINALQVRKTIMKQNVDIMNEFVELYELHGELDSRLIQKEPDISLEEKDIDYVQQMHVVSFVKTKGAYSDFILYKGKEKQDPYMLTHLIEEEGRTLSIGAVEYLFNAQWMQNHSVKNMKDTLDLASKIVFQTADSRFINRNVLTAIETGEVMIHDINKPLTLINDSNADIGAFQSFSNQWKTLTQEITSTPAMLRGGDLPSNTPYALGAMINRNAESPFDMMIESKALYIEEMLRRFIIPYLKNKLKHKKEIAVTLEEHQIQQIDALYIPKEAVKRFNEKVVTDVINYVNGQGNPPQQFNAEQENAIIQKELGIYGNVRSFTPDQVNWNEVLKDLEWKLDITASNEQQDKQAMLVTLSNVLQTLATNPLILNDPNIKLIFNKILGYTGAVSPAELGASTIPRMPVVRMTERVDFKDLPDDAKAQFLAKMGIQMNPPQQPAQQQVQPKVA